MAVPAGEVTFVFTDIEGSTALFHEIAEEFLDVLATHNEILRAVWAEHGGVEIKTEGDAFFVAFTDALSALRASAAAQRALASHPWSHGRPVRVRVGMHTGTAEVVDDDYVGLDVHEAARVAGAAHGGQVLFTEATLTSAGELSDGLTVHDLGLHRLKDFPTPRRLLQLVGPELEEVFPSPRTTTARSHNLPAPPTAMVGRHGDLEAVQRGVRGEARLVTITGAGGLGKTRLALEAGWSVLGWFREGVWFVDLSDLRDAVDIPEAIVEAIGVNEHDDATPVDLVVERLSQGPSLLVLDNLEQLLEGDGITVISDLLAACPDLSVLATSRERLRLRGEHDVPIDGLSASEAATLFRARAEAASRRFQATDEQVARICEAVDGIPLALELAAARARSHDPDQLLAALTGALDLLTEGDRDLPTRHRTMRATVAWSWRLLDDDERSVLLVLAVFAGAVERSALASVLGRECDATIAALADRAMVARRGDRISVLMPIRAFALEQLLVEERAELEAAHATHYAALALEASPHLTHTEQLRWLDRLDDDWPNLHLALDRLPAAAAVEMAACLVRWWVRRGRLTAGSDALRSVLERSDADHAEAADPEALARALAGAAEIAITQGRLDEASSQLDRARALVDAGSVRATVENFTGELARVRGDFDSADAAYERALAFADECHDLRQRAISLCNIGSTAFQRGSNAMYAAGRRDDEGAVRWLTIAAGAYTEARQLAEDRGDLNLELKLILNSAATEMTLGDPVEAQRTFIEARDLAGKLGDVGSRMIADLNLGLLASMGGEDEASERYFTDALATAEELGDVANAGRVLHYWSATVRRPDYTTNIAHARRSIALAEQTGDVNELEQRRQLLATLLELASSAAREGDSAVPQP